MVNPERLQTDLTPNLEEKRKPLLEKTTRNVEESERKCSVARDLLMGLLAQEVLTSDDINQQKLWGGDLIAARDSLEHAASELQGINPDIADELKIKVDKIQSWLNTFHIRKRDAKGQYNAKEDLQRLVDSISPIGFVIDARKIQEIVDSQITYERPKVKQSMKKGPEQVPDELSAEETAAELARVKEQAQGFGQGIGGLEKLEQKDKILRNLSTEELVKRTLNLAVKDPETIEKVSKKLTEQTKMTTRKTVEQSSAPPSVPKTERAYPPKKNVPTFSKYAADSGEDTLTMARHVARVRRGGSATFAPPAPPPPPVALQEKITIPAFERSAALAAPVAEATPLPPLISPEAAPKAPEGANRLDNPAFAEWFSSVEGIKAGNPAEIEKFFSAFEIKEQVKNEVLKVWRERIAKESALAMTESDLALVANQLETLAKKEPEKFVALYGETVKRFTEMPAEIARLEGELQRAGPPPERRYELIGEERKLELVRASNHFVFGFGRLTGIAARIFRTEGLKAEAEARTEIRKDEKYRRTLGGVSAGGAFEGLGISRGGAVEARLAEIEKIKEDYTKAVGMHPGREQVEIALARAKKGFQGARAGVFAEVGVQKEMSEFLSAKVAETVKQILTPGAVTTLEDWMAADEWVRELSARAEDKERLADYLRGFSLDEVLEKIALGMRETLQTTVGEIVARQLEHPENPGRATELFSALDGALGELLTKKKMGVIAGDKVIMEVTAYLMHEEKKIVREAGKGSALKATYLQSIRGRLWTKYRSPAVSVPSVEPPPTAEGLVKELEEAGLIPPEKL